MGWNQNTEEGASFTFVKKEDGADASNMASKFAKGAMRSEISLADGQLAADFESVIKGEAIYLPEFHCGKTDFALLAGLAKDMETHELASEGGGMVKARAADLLPDPFFACNADSIWLDGPQNAFSDLSAGWDPERMDALLLLVTHARAHNFDGSGDFYMDPAGQLTRKLPGRIAPFIYTGIQLVSQRLLRDAPDGKFSTNVLWDRAIAEGRLYGVAFTGRWYEVGTPAHIRPTEEALKGG